MTKHIDLRMTWRDCVHIFVALIENGTTTGKQQAIDEMKRMAWLADHAFKSLELLLLPMTHENEIGIPAAYYDVILRVVDGDVIEEHRESDLEDALGHFSRLQEQFPQAQAQDFRF